MKLNLTKLYNRKGYLSTYELYVLYIFCDNNAKHTIYSINIAINKQDKAVVHFMIKTTFLKAKHA